MSSEQRAAPEERGRVAIRARALVEKAEFVLQDEPRTAFASAEEARDLLYPRVGVDEEHIPLLARALVALSQCSSRLNGSDEAARHALAALALLGPLGDPGIRACALMGLANALSLAGDPTSALARLREGLEVVELAEDRDPIRARLLSTKGGIYFRQGEYEKALGAYDAATDIFRGLGDLTEEARVRGNQAVVWASLGAHHRAIETQLDVLALRREEGDLRGLAFSLHSLAVLFGRMNSHGEALSYGEAALRITREIGDREGEASTLQNLAETHRFMEQFELAREYCRSAIDLFREIGCPEGEAHSLATEGKLFMQAGDHDSARADFENCLAISRAVGATPVIAVALLYMAELDVLGGDYQSAVDIILGSEELGEDSVPTDARATHQDLLHKAYVGLGRFDKALEHHCAYHALVLESERVDHDHRLTELRIGHELAEARLKAETAEERGRRRGSAALNAILENTPGVAVHAYDSGGVVRLWNRGAETVFGWSNEQACGKSAGELYLAEDAAQCFSTELMRMECTDRGIEPWEGRFRSRDGTEGFAFTSLFPVIDPDGERLFVRMDVDITAREHARRELATSEAKFRRVVEHISDALVIDDPDGKVVFANDRFLEIFGIQREELESLNVAEIIAPEWRSKVWEYHERRVRGDPAPDSFEMEGSRRDGSRLWAEVTVVPIHVDGEILGTQSLIRDISERKQAEQKILESEEQLRTLFENVQDVVTVVDDTGTIIYQSPSVKQILGYEPEDNLGKSVFEHVHDEERADAEARLARGFRTNRVHHMEHRQAHRDGTWRIFASVGRAYQSGGGARRAVITSRDITEEKNSEKDRRLTQFTVNRISTAAFWIRPDGSLKYVNTAACALVGYESSELLRMRVSDFDDESTEETWPSYWEELRGSGQTPFETHLRRKDGSLVPVEVFANFVAFEGSEYACTFVHDLTERRKLRERLLQSEKMSALGLLVSGVAHELNNPLTGVIGFSELLLRSDGLPERIRRHLETIRKEAGRGHKIVHGLLTFARHRKPERQLIDANQVIEEVLDLRSYGMRVSNIEVQTNLADDLPFVSGDPHQIQQVFINIVHNAEQAMVESGAGGRLEVRTTSVDSEELVRITIQDSGPGMTPELLTKVFDPFFTTKQEGKGTGLGLAISHGIIQEHGGDISARCPEGGGTIFTVDLPVNRSVELSPDNASAGVPVSEPGNKRILVVDDEPAIVDLVRETLEAMGHSVVVAFDGKTALDRLLDGPCDAVMCDLRMPGISGAEVYHCCKRDFPELASRFLFMTGDTGTEEARRLIDGDCLLHLPKPFRLDELEKAVRALFSRKGA